MTWRQGIFGCWQAGTPEVLWPVAGNSRTLVTIAGRTECSRRDTRLSRSEQDARETESPI